MDRASAFLLNDSSHGFVSTHEQRMQLEKVLHSEAFDSSPRLKKFLEYIGSKAIEGFFDDIKEYTIAIEVFGRTAKYDPRIDTTVRVQAHRLREKLQEYYHGEGANHQILLMVPKGHYVPHFSRRAMENPKEPINAQNHDPRLEDHELQAPRRHGQLSMGIARATRRVFFTWLAAGLAGMAVLGCVILLLHRLPGSRAGEKTTRALSTATPTANPLRPLQELWGGFLKDQRSPLIVFSNPMFLSTETFDLFRVSSEDYSNTGAAISPDMSAKVAVNPRLLERAGPLFFADTLTGTGEVIGTFYLTLMFAKFNSPLEVKRSRLATTDDLMHHNLIFLGSTRENALLAGLPLSQDFVFSWPENHGRAWGGRIVNLHPLPGESAAYESDRDPKTGVLLADYALVSFLRGITPDERIAVLGGLSTLGTQGAAEFATSPTRVVELAERLRTVPPSVRAKIPPFFQAVLRVDIVKGDILGVKYITGHVLNPMNGATDSDLIPGSNSDVMPVAVRTK